MKRSLLLAGICVLASSVSAMEPTEKATVLASNIPVSVSASADLTSYKPSGWSDRIVVSNGTGTNTDSASLSPTDTLYVDWSVSNLGGAATAARFYTELYVDGVLRFTWYTDPPLSPNYHISVEDYSIGSLTAGTHSIRVKADSTNTIAESDETNNEYTKTITVGAGSGLCVADSRTLCLSGGRFQVQVGFQTSTIPAGVGAAVPLSADTGYFWFFSSSNVELVVKILDGRPFNNYFWIFYGALSDVAYTITVTDTSTGAVKTYSNPAGRLASVADTAAFPLASGIPIAHLEIDHTSVGDLVVTLGVGDPANPGCKIPVANRAGGANANLVRDVDLTPCASALPPSTSNKWFLQTQDASSGNTGQIRVFQITTGGQSFVATDVPAPIQDLQTSWSFIPSGGSPPPPPPPPSGNHAPTLSRVDATRTSHSFGRDDSYRSEGVANRPGFAALVTLTAPRVITLDGNHDGQPDSTSPIVVAAAGLPSCCTLLVAEGAADSDGDALVFHWQAATGTFYSTGTDNSGGFTFGQKITNVSVYNRNSVFFELPSIGNVIPGHSLMGGLTNPGASVTDVRSVPSQSLSSPTRTVALEWGRGVYLEVTVLDSQSIAHTDPNFPDGLEMTVFANIVGNFLASTLPTFRAEVGHPDGTRTVVDQDSTNNGARIKVKFKHSEIGLQAGITIVASTPGTASGGNPFVFPASPSTSTLDLWKSRGCTVGDHLTTTIQFTTGPRTIDVWDSGPVADDAFDLVVDGATLGRTPPGGDRLFTNMSLSSGSHNLCVVYVDCSSCSGEGTYTVRLTGDLLFSGGGTDKEGSLSPSGTEPKPPYAQACYNFSVPYVDR